MGYFVNLLDLTPGGPKLGGRSVRSCGLALTLLSGTVMPTDPLQESPQHESKAKAAPRQDVLFVVSREAWDTYLDLKRIFADDAGVTVMFDRRWRDRRRATSTRDLEGRRADRRSRPLIDDRLRRQGWIMVRRQP
jgi:hypothetical protein